MSELTQHQRDVIDLLQAFGKCIELMPSVSERDHLLRRVAEQEVEIEELKGHITDLEEEVSIAHLGDEW